MLCPDELPAAVHGHCGLLPAQLYEDRALVVPDGHVVRPLEAGNVPDALEAVVERVLEAVGVGVPDADGAVLGAGQDDGQLGVERD